MNRKLGVNFLRVSDDAMSQVILSNQNTLEFIDVHYTIVYAFFNFFIFVLLINYYFFILVLFIININLNLGVPNLAKQRMQSKIAKKSFNTIVNLYLNETLNGTKLFFFSFSFFCLPCKCLYLFVLSISYCFYIKNFDWKDSKYYLLIY